MFLTSVQYGYTIKQYFFLRKPICPLRHTPIIYLLIVWQWGNNIVPEIPDANHEKWDLKSWVCIFLLYNSHPVYKIIHRSKMSSLIISYQITVKFYICCSPFRKKNMVIIETLNKGNKTHIHKSSLGKEMTFSHPPNPVLRHF